MEWQRSQTPETVASAIEIAYADAELIPPSVASGSPIIPLRELVAGQPLRPYELDSLTRARAMAFLSDELGGSVAADGRADERLAGYLFANRVAGWILVNRNDSVVRRRYTIAHELGHYLLHARHLLADGANEFRESQPGVEEAGATDAPVAGGMVRVLGEGASSPSVRLDWEDEADRFAAALLMPEALCTALVALHADRCGRKQVVLARRLAADLLVSQTAMLRRLADLQLP